MHPFLEVKAVTRQEGGRTAVNSISFTQAAGQRIAIAGETGSGKTSLLKMIAGLVQPGSGEVLFQGKRVRGPLEKLIPGHPEIACLSQYFELRNNYRVEEELDCKNKLSEEEAERIYEVCRIRHLLKRKTNQLSGGERQRIVLAALLTTRPRLFLLDEPYSNLDPLHRDVIKSVIQDIGNVFDISFILVSHEAQDTLSWADHILVLKDGQLVQQGSPQEVYYNPADIYTAALLGDYNLLGGDFFPGFNTPDHKKLFVRPGDIQLSLQQQTGNTGFGTVASVSFCGPYYTAQVIVNNQLIKVHTVQVPPAPGTLVYLTLSIHKPWFL